MPEKILSDRPRLTSGQQALLADVSADLFALRHNALTREEVLAKVVAVRKALFRLHAELERVEVREDDGQPE